MSNGKLNKPLINFDEELAKLMDNSFTDGFYKVLRRYLVDVKAELEAKGLIPTLEAAIENLDEWMKQHAPAVEPSKDK